VAVLLYRAIASRAAANTPPFASPDTREDIHFAEKEFQPMTAYTLSTLRTTTFNLMASDTLAVTDQGSIYRISNNTAAILGAGGNVLSISGGIWSTSVIGGNALQFNAGNNSITLAAGASLYAGVTGISASGGNNTIVSYADIFAQDPSAAGIAIAGGGGNVLTLHASSHIVAGSIGVNLTGDFNSVANTGFISAATNYGLRCSGGGNSIFNGGTIFGTIVGVYAGGAGAASTVVNSGLIWSTGEAVFAVSSLNVTNTGQVDGLHYGIHAAGADPSVIMNLGYVYARFSDAVTTGGGNDTVVNNGFVQGGILAATLGGGNDLFDGRNGIQVGTVDGGG
jgi:fibronectin-binding autotransporter adhesin